MLKEGASCLLRVCSTIYPGSTQELEDRAQEAGCRLLSCPVFGRPDAVKAGNALFVCAGDPAAKEQARSSIRYVCRSERL